MFDILLKLNVIAMAIHADSWKQTLPYAYRNGWHIPCYRRYYSYNLRP